jgi:hypothetical protein
MLRTLLPIAASSLAACLAPSALADIVINLDDTTWLAGDFTLYFQPGELEGTLTAISMDGVTCSADPQVTALTAYLSTAPFSDDALMGLPFAPSSGGRLQVGGNVVPGRPLDLMAEEWGSWVAPSPPDFILNDTYVLENGGFDIASYGFMLGNGITPPPSGGIERSWSGMVTLHGVTEVLPTPGVLALTGLAGLVLRPRRRRAD